MNGSVSDAVLVALMQEALNADNRPRRAAAGILIEVLRSKDVDGTLPKRLETVAAEDGPAVAAAMRVLMEEHRLGRFGTER